MRKSTFYFLLASLMDVWTTILCLNTGEIFEGNPLLLHLGWTGLIAVKFIGTVLVAVVLQCKKEYDMDLAVPCVVALFVLGNAIVFSMVV